MSNGVCTFDRAIMVKVSGRFICTSNIVVNEQLTSGEQTEMDTQGFIFRPISETEVHILVNRLDVGALQTATNRFYTQF